MSMATYMSIVAADYTTTELSVTPQKVLVENVKKAQVAYETDDGAITVVSKSDTSIFDVTLQWDVLSISDAETIESFYCSASKANGMENTFYWHHPLETTIYTVRFLSPLEKSYKSSLPGYASIGSVTFRVEGKKA